MILCQQVNEEILTIEYNVLTYKITSTAIKNVKNQHIQQLFLQTPKMYINLRTLMSFQLFLNLWTELDFQVLMRTELSIAC